MLADEDTPTPTEAPAGEPDDVVLARFLSCCPAVATAAQSLRAGAEVAVSFTDLEGEWRCYAEAGNITLEPGKPRDPDFALRLAPGAIKSICVRTDADIGQLGIAFFEHVVSREPDYRIRVQLHSGLIKLTQRGWLTLLARGGPSVAGWLARRGFRGSSAVVAAIARLKSAW
jgi:hypothetical protein